jgi:hypothetical protein
MGCSSAQISQMQVEKLPDSWLPQKDLISIDPNNAEIIIIGQD